MGTHRSFRPGTLWLGLGLIWLILGFSLLGLQFWKQRGPWEFGQDRGGDLKQHYAVALMLEKEKGDYKTLYRDFAFSEEITRVFNRDLFERGEYLDRHNYRYGPLIAWISWQLHAIPYGTWVKVWQGLSLVLAGGAFLLLRKTEEGVGTPPDPVLETVLFLGFPPLLYGLSICQNAPLTLFLSAVSAWLLKNRREWLAGLVFGSICYKPQLMPYIAGIMLLCGQWRFAFATGFATAFWLGVGLLLCGWESHRYWIESLMEIIHGVQGDEMGTNMPWKGFVLTVLPESYQASGLLLANILGFLLLGVLVFFVHRVKKHSQWQNHHIFYLVLTWWLLFTPHVKSYEMILALPLMMVLLRLGSPGKLQANWALGCLYVSGFVVVASRFVGFSGGAPFVTAAFLLAVVALAGHLPSQKFKMGNT